MFELAEEHRMLQDLVAKFVNQELMPLERAVLAREAGGGKVGLTEAEEAPLHAKCKELGLWGLDVPEELGGANLPTVALMAVNEELGRTCVPFFFPPDSPNLHMLMAVVNDDQRARYLLPYADGSAKSAIAISEPGAGGDPAGMITRAVREGPDGKSGDWVINGRKIWISRVPNADFTIVMARTGEGKRHEGVSAFVVEKGTPGFIVEREIQMLGGQRTYEVVLENCRVPASQLLGREGAGFAPMQLRLTIRRLQMGAWCTGMAEAGRPTGGAVVDHRRGDAHPCLPADGDGRRRQAGCRAGRAHRGLDDQGVRHRDGAGRDRPRHAGLWRDGRDQRAAVAADGAEGADDAGVRGAVGSAPDGDRAADFAGEGLVRRKRRRGDGSGGRGDGAAGGADLSGGAALA